MKLTRPDLHIISFDVPYPANYGGVIDVFYKLKSLYNLGLKVSLHCFDYGRGKPAELEKYCSEIYYYKRSLSLTQQFDSIPFIVKTRINEELIKNLIRDDRPIIFEGLHTCGIIKDQRITSRLKLIRMHNIEHLYYKGLASVETNLIKKTYFQLEAQKLEKYEPIISKADKILAISKSDADHFKKFNSDSIYLPAFIEPQGPYFSYTIEDFCLYHGNLKVVENQNALDFLIEVFSKLRIKLVVAGKDPSQKLKNRISEIKNIKLIENPTNVELNELVSKAKLNCLPTFQSTGVKLKLIKALSFGNLVLVNDEMIEGTDLGSFCRVANTVDEWRKTIRELFDQEVILENIMRNRQAVQDLYDNNKNAILLKELLV